MEPCSVCEGKGEVMGKPCAWCGGTGLVEPTNDDMALNDLVFGDPNGLIEDDLQDID